MLVDIMIGEIMENDMKTASGVRRGCIRSEKIEI